MSEKQKKLVLQALDRLFDVAGELYYRDSTNLAKAANDHELIRAFIEGES